MKIPSIIPKLAQMATAILPTITISSKTPVQKIIHISDIHIQLYKRQTHAGHQSACDCCSMGGSQSGYTLA